MCLVPVRKQFYYHKIILKIIFIVKHTHYLLVLGGKSVHLHYFSVTIVTWWSNAEADWKGVMYINILQQAFEDGKRIMGNIERNKLFSLWMDLPSKRCGWISIVDLTGLCASSLRSFHIHFFTLQHCKPSVNWSAFLCKFMENSSYL